MADGGAFAVDAAGVATVLPSQHARLEHMGVPGEVSAAYDLLTDDGMSPDRAAEIAFGMHEHAQAGGKPVPEQVDHLLGLRRAARRR